VFPSLGHRPASTAALLAFVVLTLAEPLYVDSSGCMPGFESEEPGGRRFHAWHLDRSLRPPLGLESVAEVLAALVGIPFHFGC